MVEHFHGKEGVTSSSLVPGFLKLLQIRYFGERFHGDLVPSRQAHLPLVADGAAVALDLRFSELSSRPEMKSARRRLEHPGAHGRASLRPTVYAEGQEGGTESQQGQANANRQKVKKLGPGQMDHFALG